MLSCHADCPLPPPLSSVPPLISGPSLSASPPPSPASPLLPTVLKSFEAQMWADSGYFLSRHDSFMCHKRSIHIGYKQYRVIMNPNTLAGRSRPGHPGTCQYCHVLYSSLPQPHTLGVCVLTKPCLSRGGFTGLQPPAIAIPSTLPSPKLEGQRQSPWRKQHKRGKVVMQREDSLLCYPMIFWLTEHSK